MYFKCDYCGKEGNGITMVNGFNMCPMCYAEYLNKQQKPIEHDSFLLSKIDRLENKVIELQEKLKEMKGDKND